MSENEKNNNIDGIKHIIESEESGEKINKQKQKPKNEVDKIIKTDNNKEEQDFLNGIFGNKD